jgi:hypothetical protein
MVVVVVVVVVAIPYSEVPTAQVPTLQPRASQGSSSPLVSPSAPALNRPSNHSHASVVRGKHRLMQAPRRHRSCRAWRLRARVGPLTTPRPHLTSRAEGFGPETTSINRPHNKPHNHDHNHASPPVLTTQAMLHEGPALRCRRAGRWVISTSALKALPTGNMPPANENSPVD